LSKREREKTVDRIRVVHIINDMTVGGAQRQVANLFRAMDRERFDLHLICLAKKGALGEELEHLGFPVESLGKTGRIHPGMVWRLFRLLRRLRPDVVHCSVFTANLWGRLAAIAARAPVRLAHEQSTVSLEKWHRRLIDRILSWFTHRVLVVSNDLRTRVLAEEGLQPERVEVLYNAVDCEAIERAQKPSPPDLPGVPGRRIGIVGRLEYRKDHLTLIRTARQVLDAMPDATFLLVGDGPDRARIEAEIDRLGLGENVLLLGERDDVPQLLHAFDVYALSSLTEGLSLSILEAMAAGRPIVATNVGGNPELLDAGRAGILVKPGGANAMALGILRMLREPDAARTLGQKARERARDVFDIQPVARRLERIYIDALGDRGRKFDS
jgi:glycosyltransferase involved in cell wall biosynthesis